MNMILSVLSENVSLRRQLKWKTQEAAAAKEALRHVTVQRDEAREGRDQARRDADLLVNFARDPREAREFLSTQRDIGAL